MSPRLRLVVVAAVWLAVLTCAAVLGWLRFRAAASAGQPDFDGFFLPAAEAVKNLRSPYSVDGYYYSPIVALLLVPAVGQAWAIAYWTAVRIAAGIAACVVAAVAIAPRGDWMRSGLVAGIAVVTLLWSWPATLDLWAGQVEFIVLLTLASSAWALTRDRRVLSGAMLGAAAAVKTWPALFALWLLRRPWTGRSREWLGVAIAAATTLLLTLIVAGPQGVADLVRSAVSGGDQPLLAANSVWGVSRMLFSPTPMGAPLMESAVLQIVSAVVLAAWVLTLLVIVLRRPGDSVVALWNVAFIVILMLPVSHYFYVIYAVPVLWWWANRVMVDPRSAMAWVALAALGVWWVVVFRVSPDGDGFMTTTWPSLLRIFATSLIALTLSVIGAARLTDPGHPTAGRASTTQP